MNKFFQKLSDLTHIHHRAAFTDLPGKDFSGAAAFEALVKGRFSCRAFQDTPLSQEQLDYILEAARLAPTAVNRQPVHIWVVQAREYRDKLKETSAYTYDAPVIFIVGCRPEDAWVRKYDGKNGAEIDAAIVGTHIMMEAADLGLGCTWVGSFDPAKLKEVLPQIGEWVPVAMFPVGHILGEPSARHSERKAIEDLVTKL